MKRLLCLVSAMNTGGAETFLMKIYRMIDKTLYQMDFCVNEQRKGFYDDEIVELGGKIFRIPSKSENYKEFNIQLLNLIRSNKYDSVLRITSNAFGFLDCKIAKEAGVKKCIVRSSNSADAEGIYALLVHSIGKALYSRYVDVKIAPSDLAAKYTFGNKAYLNGDVNILHNGLDIDAYSYDENERKRIRKEFNIMPSDLLVGHIGRFSRQKNHDFLIEVFDVLHNQCPNSRLLLVGDGEEKEHIQTKVQNLNLSDCVMFAGIRNDIPNLMSALDVLLLPSLYEGMPNVVIEAQANGLPCLISDSITKEADITNLVHYLSIKETPENWAARIQCLDKKKRSESTKTAMTKAGYDIRFVVSQFQELCY